MIFSPHRPCPHHPRHTLCFMLLEVLLGVLPGVLPGVLLGVLLEVLLHHHPRYTLCLIIILLPIPCASSAPAPHPRTPTNTHAPGHLPHDHHPRDNLLLLSGVWEGRAGERGGSGQGGS